MTTKDKIIIALQSHKSEIESECFCRIALKGGYENFVRDLLFEGLLKLKETNLDTEVLFNRIDEFGKKKQNRLDILSGSKSKQNYLIELGHNGTWQNPFNVVNHAIDDINDSFLFPDIKTQERYTVSILTNIIAFNPNETFRLRKSYLKGIEDNINNGSDINVNATKKYFIELGCSGEPIKMKCSWNGFKIELYFFVCGPFPTKIDKTKIKN